LPEVRSKAIFTDVSALDVAPAFDWRQSFAADRIGFFVPRMLQLRSIVIASLNNAADRNGGDKVQIPGFAKFDAFSPPH
jgi:hypothetical protein